MINMNKPLADLIRPLELDQMVGQEHLIGPKGIIRRMIANNTISNMIFYGPSGTGKTTLANIIASMTNRTLHKLNATSAGTKDIKEIIASLNTLEEQNGILLYLDEIQYFTKKQQQSLLETIEDGSIVLIASTTENPYFYIYSAILSRSTVFEFKLVDSKDILKALNRGYERLKKSLTRNVIIEPDVLPFLAKSACGDVRRALNYFELLFSSAQLISNTYYITMQDAELVASNNAARYDRDGDQHYDILSAFQKSIRGSDPDAAIHYLARLLSGGDIISPCRRLLVIASEDIGLAYPQASIIVKSLIDSAHQLGLPEARIPLAEATIFLATCPKSNSAINAIDQALEDLKKGAAFEIPSYLRDAHYAGAKDLGRGLTYLYPHSYPSHYVQQQYLPNELKDTVYYTFGDNKIEKSTKEYWDNIKNKN